jgi:N-acetylglutamate synthase-like GNAT family acetyltransferase
MIRRARHTDWPAISRLLDQLEYPGTEAFLPDKFGRMLEDPAETVLVWDSDPSPSDTTPSDPSQSDPRSSDTRSFDTSPSGILGLLSLHIIPQIALAGDFARISYFAVDTAARSKGIGLQMEEYATQLAREKGCELIEVHCHTRRTRAHEFYARQGYIESPKYLIKRLK